MPRVLGLLLVVAACSSHPPHGSDPGRGTGTAGRPGDAAAAPATVDAGAQALTRDECGQIVDHVLDVELADMRTRKKPDEMPTDDQIAQIRAKLSDEMMAQCLAWDRASYDCITAATDLAAIQTCVGGS
jgi:small lipoprotein (TIGR04454 family)